MANRIQIDNYKQDWVNDYQKLAVRILLAVPNAIHIHHIGSTAIPNLAAKNVIDIQLTVALLECVEREALACIGFIEREGLSDHAPEGLILAPEELIKRFFKMSEESGQCVSANLHVRQSGRFNQRYALLCRDYLRSHPEAAQAYAMIKKRLADRFFDDEDYYYAIKDPVFDIIMAGANDWAHFTGWQQPKSD